MKFRLKKDWYVDNFFDKVKIYNEGHIFIPDVDGKYHITGVNGYSHFMSFSDMLNAKLGEETLFQPINEDQLDIIVEEMPIDSDDVVKKWRIQLDVNTSLNKLKLIQKYLQDNIPNLL